MTSGSDRTGSLTQNSAAQARIDWAKRYPFAPFGHEHFVFAQGEARKGTTDLQGKRAVVAAGSNASPQQLRRKFGIRQKPIVVTSVTLAGWAVVHSAHFSSYGSIPATLVPASGAITRTALTWLDDDDLAIMHRTEAIGVNYDYAATHKIEAVDDLGQSIVIDGFYQSRRGVVRANGQPIRLAAALTTGVTWPALTQPAILSWAAARIAPDRSLDEFLWAIIDDPAYRQTCQEKLQAIGAS